MSNKKWRKPANPDYNTPALDPSRIEPATRGSDAAAREILLRTADFLDEFVQSARAALKRVAPEKLDAILNQAEPEPEGENHRKRPRGAAHPILVLHKLAAGAARLLKQVLRATNPGVFARTPDEMDLWALAKQSDAYVQKLNQARAEASQ